MPADQSTMALIKKEGMHNNILYGYVYIMRRLSSRLTIFLCIELDICSTLLSVPHRSFPAQGSCPIKFCNVGALSGKNSPTTVKLNNIFIIIILCCSRKKLSITNQTFLQLQKFAGLSPRVQVAGYIQQVGSESNS